MSAEPGGASERLASAGHSADLPTRFKQSVILINLSAIFARENPSGRTAMLDPQPAWHHQRKQAQNSVEVGFDGIRYPYRQDFNRPRQPHSRGQGSSAPPH